MGFEFIQGQYMSQEVWEVAAKNKNKWLNEEKMEEEGSEEIE